jgi:GMP synthase-like glutamine amidotransferase
VLAGLPSPFPAARYHSLVIARDTLPPELRALAFAEDDGEIMAVEHRTHPVVGVQFHPESAATEYGYWILDRFITGAHRRELPTGADGEDARQEPGHRRTTPFVPPPVELVR